MIDRLRKTLVCAVMAAPMIGVCVTPASAASETPAPAPAASEAGEVGVLAGYWSSICEDGRACVRSNVPAGYPAWYNFNGCGAHAFYPKALAGIAHGNRFRVTYQDNRWDEVAAWSSRPLDGNNNPKSVYVYC